jgi:hypothetical protein
MPATRRFRAYCTMKPEQLPEITGGLMRVMERARTPKPA